MPATQVMTPQEIDEILKRPDGTSIVLSLSRDGMVDVYVAAEALSRDRERMGRSFKRFLVAMTEALLADR
mgnify:CR=1 FL=1